ncbi:MAG: DUF1501 domain-containing protein, partial [Verrucomicrobiae bacterium]|nr:DUF1501 domain-containing protein [Verrucomicrobiae bacterium]
MTRRSALKAGALSAFGLSTGDFLRLKANAQASDTGKSVILIWLDGGPSHFETYDPKPEAPSEYRGPWGDRPTNVPGIRFSEMLPLHAKHADAMCVLRSVHHDNGDHFAAAHWMLTGRFGSTSADKTQKYPSVGSCVSKLAPAKVPDLPNYVGLPAAESVFLYPGYQGAAYLGGSYDPFQVNLKQKYLAANSKVELQKPPFLDSVAGLGDRINERAGLLKQLDGINREIDRTGSMNTMDEHQQSAMDILLGSHARQAFDLDQESDKVRDRYGRGPWGHYTLMARRLVESGVRFVTVDMPHWDTHSSMKTGMETRLPHLDMAIDGLMQDLKDRHLLNDVLVVVMGEFGRTPKINNGLPNDPVPGRDHWGQAMSVLMAGG